MKIRLSLTLSIERAARPHPETPPHVDESAGALVEQIGQRRYLGFTPEEPA